MSVSQMKRVFEDTTLKGNEKLLMLALADNANETGVCFPSWNSLMTKTSMSRGSISKWINELVGKGLLYKKHRSRKNGGRSSNKYLLYPSINFELLDEEDAIIFDDLHGQSSEVELGELSSEVELGVDSQSSEVELECEPSLKNSNHHSSNESKNMSTKVYFKSLLEEIKKSVSRKSKVTFTEKAFDAYKLIEDKSKIKDHYLQHQELKEQYAQSIANFLVDYKANVKELTQSPKKDSFDLSGKNYDEEGKF